MVLADICVCLVSAPITMALYFSDAFANYPKLAACFQHLPIFAGTLSSMYVSIYRLIIVLKYQFRILTFMQDHLLLIVFVSIWLIAILLSVTLTLSDRTYVKISFICRIVFLLVIPLVVVVGTHLHIYYKLHSLSLSDRASHGDLPLPMPLLGQPAQPVILVSRLPGDERHNLRQIAEETRPAVRPPVERLPSSTVRDRHRCARLMIAYAVIFAACWLPLVGTLVCESINIQIPEPVKRYFLYLGHLHSLLGPIEFWILKLDEARRQLKKFRMRRPRRARRPDNPSSTNDIELGPFDPRLVRPPPRRAARERPSSVLF